MPDEIIDCESVLTQFAQWRAELDKQFMHLRTHYRIWERMVEAQNTDLDSVNRVPGMWGYTTKAHLESAIMGLSRLTDISSRSGSIRQLIGFVRRHEQCFDNTHQPIDRQKLKQIGDKLKPSARLIENLRIVRDKIYAHMDRDTIGKSDELHSQYPILRKDFEQAMSGVESALTLLTVAYDGISFAHGAIVAPEGVDEILSALRRQSEYWQQEYEKYSGNAE